MVATLLSVLSMFFKEKMAENAERTFIMVKVDGVERGIIGEIMTRFEKRGFKLVAAKFIKATEDHIKTHYKDLSAKKFYEGLCKFASSGPVFAMVWEGLDAVKTGRKMLGETNPLESLPGTIRGDYCISIGRNIVHGSDSVESANHEIGLWFKDAELVDWTPTSHKWIYE